MTWEIRQGDALERLREMPDESVHCCVTSPPYWGLRDYGVDGQLGLEETPEQFVAAMVEVFAEMRRVLRSDGTLWLNIGDGYAGSSMSGGDGSASRLGATGKGTERANRQGADLRLEGKRVTPGLKPKDLVGIPWMLAFALRADGWYLRRDIIWAKPNPMPESVTDRPTSAHEYLFLLTKSGAPTFWVHREGGGTRERPAPDHRWVDRRDGGEVADEPDGWQTETFELDGDEKKRWRRINLWQGRDYYYDAEAIREAATYAGPNGPQHSPHAQGFARRTPEQERERQDKQRGHGRRHDGFNDRWDAMSKEEQQAVGRNKRSVWTIATKPFADAHFATFPPDLVEPCIRAGTSSKVCGECGAPRRRVTEATFIPQADVAESAALARSSKGLDASSGWADTPRGHTERRTTGREAVCSHTDDTGRAVVLDPFTGAATTGLVATQLGRDFVGVELNPEYVALGEGRIRRWEADPAGHLRRQTVDEAQIGLELDVA